MDMCIPVVYTSWEWKFVHCLVAKMLSMAKRMHIVKQDIDDKELFLVECKFCGA